MLIQEAMTGGPVAVQRLRSEQDKHKCTVERNQSNIGQTTLLEGFLSPSRVGYIVSVREREVGFRDKKRTIRSQMIKDLILDTNRFNFPFRVETVQVLY